MRLKRTDRGVLEVIIGGLSHIVRDSAPVTDFSDGKTEIRVSNDSGIMEIVLRGKGIIEARSLGLGSTYRIDADGLID